MADHREQISELAAIMDEYGLGEARARIGDLTVGFKRRTVQATDAEEAVSYVSFQPAQQPAKEEAPKGSPITSPMTGIFYASPSPSSPPFCKEGEPIAAGQPVGLIEAMKVFNEIPSPLSGTVLKLVAESGQLVQAGEVLLYVG